MEYCTQRYIRWSREIRNKELCILYSYYNNNIKLRAVFIGRGT